MGYVLIHSSVIQRSRRVLTLVFGSIPAGSRIQGKIPNSLFLIELTSPPMSVKNLSLLLFPYGLNLSPGKAKGSLVPSIQHTLGIAPEIDAPAFATQ
jgi:hypothetical protein